MSLRIDVFHAGAAQTFEPCRSAGTAKALTHLLVAVSLLGVSARVAQAQIIASSTFDSGADGWTARAGREQ